MTTNIIRKLLFGLTLAFSLLAHGETINGRVIGISDGDTLTILDASNVQFKIRLAAIDAPEKAQPFGQRGKQQLSSFCYDKSASVKVVSLDRYGRTVGDIDCAGINANQAMVQFGFAWVYRKYDKGYGHLYTLEDKAKNSRRGLWADPNPIPPWEWRKTKRNSGK